MIISDYFYIHMKWWAQYSVLDSSLYYDGSEWGIRLFSVKKLNMNFQLTPIQNWCCEANKMFHYFYFIMVTVVCYCELHSKTVFRLRHFSSEGFPLVHNMLKRKEKWKTRHGIRDITCYMPWHVYFICLDGSHITMCYRPKSLLNHFIQKCE